MPHQENMNDAKKVNTNGPQSEIASAKRVWSRPECRRLHISHETAGDHATRRAALQNACAPPAREHARQSPQGTQPSAFVIWTSNSSFCRALPESIDSAAMRMPSSIDAAVPLT